MLTRKEQLVFCKKCTNRKNSDLGLICKITNEKAAFESECADFEVDKVLESKMIEEDTLAKIDKETKPGIGTLFIGLFLILRGGMRMAQGQIVFGLVMVAIGISSIVYYVK